MFFSGKHVVSDGNALSGGLDASLLQDLDHASGHRFRLSLRVDVELTNNTFSKNLWSVIQRTTDWTSVDEKEFDKLEDLKFKKCSGNMLAMSGVPLGSSLA